MEDPGLRSYQLWITFFRRKQWARSVSLCPIGRSFCALLPLFT